MRFVLFALILATTFGCTESKDLKKSYRETLLASQWEFDWQTMQDSFMAQSVSDRDIRFFQNFKSRSESIVFKFMDNGLMEVDVPNGETQGGVWDINLQNKTMILKVVETPLQTPFPILDFSEEKIILGPGSKELFPLYRILKPIPKPASE
ncbi:MAG: hypothetical protein MRY78_05690 [Saprospiraceae bacterium]|nr:hypothetical protein [Saprospiraceae bacterium]